MFKLIPGIGSKRLKSHSGGAIDLYYADSKKLETANTGVKITGGLLTKMVILDLLDKY